MGNGKAESFVAHFPLVEYTTNKRGKYVTKLEYTFKTDLLFKKLFVEYPDLLKKLVSSLLGIPLESIGQFDITNPAQLQHGVAVWLKKCCVA